MNLNTPWRVEERDGWCVLLDAPGAVICTGLDDDIAAEIARRVNAFDWLVEALEEIWRDEGGFEPRVAAKAALARAVLALAAARSSDGSAP